MTSKEDFVDTYHNLTYKGVAALRWIDAYCSQATFVLKTDDDIFVNMFSLMRFLKKTTHQTPRPHGLLMCCVWNGMPVQRSRKCKVCFLLRIQTARPTVKLSITSPLRPARYFVCQIWFLRVLCCVTIM